MGFLIYENEYCIVDGKPVDFQDMQDLGIQVKYTENRKDIVEGIYLNYSLDSELTTKKLECLGLKELFESAKEAYKDLDSKGCYLYYSIKDRTIKCDKLSSRNKNNEITIIEEFEKDKFEHFDDFWDIIYIKILISLKRTRPRIYLF